MHPDPARLGDLPLFGDLSDEAGDWPEQELETAEAPLSIAQVTSAPRGRAVPNAGADLALHEPSNS